MEPKQPTQAQKAELLQAEQRRTQNATLSMINYMREANAPVVSEVNRVYSVYGDDDGRIDMTRYNRRRQAVTLSTITASVSPILVRRDNFAKRSAKQAYQSAWYEGTWLAANSAGNVVDLGDPKKRLARIAFENPSSKLATPAELRLSRQQFIRRVHDTIVRGANSGKTITQMAKDVDKVFGFRDSRGRLVIPPNPTPEQLKRLPKFVQVGRDGKLVFRAQDGRVMPISFTTTPRIPTGGEIYNSVRTVRTELHRMQGRAAIDAMKNAQAMGIDERLQKLSVLDGRTREQSRIMDGQISNAEGLFKYPDISTPRPLGDSGNPAFDVNDRGIPVEVILDFDDELAEQVSLAEEQGRFISYDTFQDYSQGTSINIEQFGPVYVGPR